MKNTCPQPNCGAAYDLSGQALGTQFICTKCGQTLAVERDGLRLASDEAAPPPAAARGGASAAAATSAAASYVTTNAPEVLDRMQRVADLSTWMFGAGALIALCALFFPLIDQAKVGRLEAMIVAGDMRQERLSAVAQREDATADDKEDAEAARKRWRDRKLDLEESVESAEMWRRGWLYYYRYLTLAGFVLLMLGSFGYLDSRQGLMRRILGCIVLTAMVLVVLNALARTSFRLEIGPTF